LCQTIDIFLEYAIIIHEHNIKRLQA